MKLIVITNGDAVEMRDAKEIASNVLAEGFEVQAIDWESDEAPSITGLYDIYSTPAFIIVGDDGREIEKWQGNALPLESDIKHLM